MSGPDIGSDDTVPLDDLEVRLIRTLLLEKAASYRGGPIEAHGRQTIRSLDELVGTGDDTHAQEV